MSIVFICDHCVDAEAVCIIAFAFAGDDIKMKPHLQNPQSPPGGPKMAEGKVSIPSKVIAVTVAY